MKTILIQCPNPGCLQRPLIGIDVPEFDGTNLDAIKEALRQKVPCTLCWNEFVPDILIPKLHNYVEMCKDGTIFTKEESDEES